MVRTQGLVRRGRRASGAVFAQLVQALTSLVLQVAAVRALGAEGLGVFGLLYSGLVLATAISTGLVGDSLTVLDRGRSPLRGGLQVVGLAVALLAGVAAAAASSAFGLLPWGSSILLGVAITVFIVEELVRRLLMASLKFWSVVLVDLTCLVVTISWLVVTVVAARPLQMTDLLLALVVAQGIGLVVAVRLLPESERWLAPWRGAAGSSVLRFGAWRAAQQGVRPATLTTTRTIVVIAAGTVAFGQLEAARVYTAPTMLAVNGVGGFLFATYAADQRRPLGELVRRADVGAMWLFAGVVLSGVAALLLIPWAGPLVTGGAFSLDATAAFGWVLYAAATALLMPYGGLAAVSGMHVKVFALRTVEAAVSISAVAAVVFVLDASASWAPYALAMGALVSAAIIRQRVLLRANHPGAVVGGHLEGLEPAEPLPQIPAADLSIER